MASYFLEFFDEKGCDQRFVTEDPFEIKLAVEEVLRKGFSFSVDVYHIFDVGYSRPPRKE